MPGRAHYRAGMRVLIAALAVAIWQDTPAVDAQADMERVLLALSSHGQYRDEIAGELLPWNNDSRYPNASRVTVTEASTGMSSRLAPWQPPLVLPNDELKLGAFCVDPVAQKLYAVTQELTDKNTSYLVSQDFRTGEERAKVTLDFSPITSIAYYNGTILTFRQHCDSGTGRPTRWCRSGSRGQTVPRPGLADAADLDGHGGLYAVIANATDGTIITEEPLPPTVLRVLPGLTSLDEATQKFYAAVIMADAAPGIYPNDTHIIAIDVSTAQTFDNYTFRFPWRMTSLQTMRYTRSRTVLQPMSSVLTMDLYYEQTVLLGLRIGDEGPEVSAACNCRPFPLLLRSRLFAYSCLPDTCHLQAFSVDPSNGGKHMRAMLPFICWPSLSIPIESCCLKRERCNNLTVSPLPPSALRQPALHPAGGVAGQRGLRAGADRGGERGGGGRRAGGPVGARPHADRGRVRALPVLRGERPGQQGADQPLPRQHDR
eukprot:SAG22_NODE_1391_length_4517_cov_30.127166_1_plen_486_part_00